MYYRITDFGRFSRDGYSWPLRPFPSSGVSIRSGGVLYRGEGFHTLRGNFRLYYLHPFGIRIKEETSRGIIVLPYYRFRAVLSMGDRETRPPSHRREEIRPRPERIERERDRGYSIPFGCIYVPTRGRRVPGWRETRGDRDGDRLQGETIPERPPLLHPSPSPVRSLYVPSRDRLSSLRSPSVLSMYHRRPSLERETGTDIYSLSVVTMYLQGRGE